ncbi:MAG: hypothetical protein QG564_1582 [Campylobacterota bacterium]|nr:hypothetical protein [Campylobacterota bacterium]
MSTLKSDMETFSANVFAGSMNASDFVFERSDQIKAEYLASGCQASDVDEAIEKLMSECGEIFADDVAAWEFLMEEEYEG